MPYSKEQGHDECADGEWAVVKDEDGEVMGCHATEEAADDQIAAIEANEQSTGKKIYAEASGPSVVLHTEPSSTTEKRPDPDIPEDLQKLRSQHEGGGIVTARFRHRQTRQLDASDSRLEAINRHHSDITLQPEDVEIFRDYAVHDLGPQSGMRVPIRFTLDALQKLGEDFERGRTMNVHHNGERQVGSTFAASIERDVEVRGVTATWLAVDWYAPLIDASEQRKQDIADMRTGVLRYTSIEFAGGERTEQRMETGDGHSYFFEIDRREEGQFRDELEAEGIARVGLGAVRGAGAS